MTAPPVIVRLVREVRLAVPLDAGALDAACLEPRRNTFAGWPAPDTLSIPFVLLATCRGRPDPRSGYLVGIDRIDAAIRASVLEAAKQDLASAGADPKALLQRIASVAATHLRADRAELVRLTWNLTPHRSIAMELQSVPPRVRLIQQFEFAAAHRLRRPECDDAENARLFGKCRNMHGHNYRLEVVVSTAVDDASFGHRELAAAVQAAVLVDFDHADLNALADFDGRLPSVEHIAESIHGRLDRVLGDPGARLEQVQVWETEKTSCIYPG